MSIKISGFGTLPALNAFNGILQSSNSVQEKHKHHWINDSEHGIYEDEPQAVHDFDLAVEFYDKLTPGEKTVVDKLIALKKDLDMNRFGDHEKFDQAAVDNGPALAAMAKKLWQFRVEKYAAEAAAQKKKKTLPATEALTGDTNVTPKEMPTHKYHIIDDLPERNYYKESEPQAVKDFDYAVQNYGKLTEAEKATIDRLTALKGSLNLDDFDQHEKFDKAAVENAKALAAIAKRLKTK